MAALSLMVKNRRKIEKMTTKQEKQLVRVSFRRPTIRQYKPKFLFLEQKVINPSTTTESKFNIAVVVLF